MPGDSETAFHFSLRVRDLGESVEFYKILLGVEPAKHYKDYAKFETADPALVLSLEPAAAPQPPGLSHLGLRVSCRAGVLDHATRLAEGSFEFQHLQGIECCYSRQTKIFLNDPDGHLIEVYTVEGDVAPSDGSSAAPSSGGEASAAAGTSTAAGDPGQRSYDHLLPTPFPLPLDAPDGSLDAINLRGTFNADIDVASHFAILAECSRALRPGGKLTTHLLVADKETQAALPTLPEPASHVRRAPTVRQVTQACAESGFIGLARERYSHAAVFAFAGCSFREFLMTARKPLALEIHASKRRAVVYKGPFPSVTDECGQSYPRGERVEPSAASWALLRSEAYAGMFIALDESQSGCGPT